MIFSGMGPPELTFVFTKPSPQPLKLPPRIVIPSNWRPTSVPIFNFQLREQATAAERKQLSNVPQSSTKETSQTSVFKTPPRRQESNASKRKRLTQDSRTNSEHHSPFRSAVIGIMTAKDRRKASGVTHFIRFRQFCEKPSLVQPGENINEVMMEFIAYLMIHATKVNCGKTVGVYLTHVKQWNVQNYFVTAYGNNNVELQWQNYSAEFHAFRTETTLWYKKLSNERGTRQPTTTGLLQFLVNGENGYGGTLNITGHLNLRLWISELMCLFAGVRKGDILLLSADPTKWKGKDVRKKDLTISDNMIQLSVQGKCDGVLRERALILRSEVTPIVQLYGKQFDIFELLKEIKQEDAADYNEDDLLFAHTDGTPILYRQYWAWMDDATARAGLPKGSATGHGGRIRLCTLLMIQGHSEVYIMSRGRWKSDCWMIYFRLFTILPNKNAVSFRLGELNIDLRNYPPVSEFRK